MKAWILTAVLAVALIGGAATAVAPDGDHSDSTVAVGIADAGDVLVALTVDAATAHQQAQHLLTDRSLEVPVCATSVAFALGNTNELIDSKTPTRGQPIHAGKLGVTDSREICHSGTPERRQSTHRGKPRVTDSQRIMVAHGLHDRSHPLLC